MPMRKYGILLSFKSPKSKFGGNLLARTVHEHGQVVQAFSNKKKLKNEKTFNIRKKQTHFNILERNTIFDTVNRIVYASCVLQSTSVPLIARRQLLISL